MSMVIYYSFGNLEIDYEKKEVRAGDRSIDFGRISHYEFEHVKTGHGDYETMRVCGTCEELPDMSPEAESHAALHDEVGLKLWFNYYQNEELKQSSLDFSQKDAVEARRKLKPFIKYLKDWRASENFNMFVGEEHLRIGNSASLNVPLKDFNLYEAELPVFGPCSISAYGTNRITHVNLVTKRRLDEEEMLPMLDYMKKSMPTESYYDDHGYGVMPKPHEINLFWELPQGRVEMSWDGRGDGLDYVRIDLWDCEVLQQSRDEEYYRSLVD